MITIVIKVKVKLKVKIKENIKEKTFIGVSEDVCTATPGID